VRAVPFRTRKHADEGLSLLRRRPAAERTRRPATVDQNRLAISTRARRNSAIGVPIRSMITGIEIASGGAPGPVLFGTPHG